MELEYKDPGNYESPEEKAIMFHILRLHINRWDYHAFTTAFKNIT